MKKEEVPQDDGLLQGKTRDLYYVLDENGNYVSALSTGWEPKNIVMQQAWDVINESVDEAKNKFLNKEASSLLYYMEKNQMDIKLLAQYTNINKNKIKDHLKFGGLNNASEDELQSYADAFRITIDQLKTIS